MQELIARGATVRALVRPNSKIRVRYPEVAYTEVDLLNANAVRGSAVWNDVTHVFHLAGATNVPSLADFHGGNVTPLENVLDALCRRQLAPRVVLVSSLAAAGPAHNAQSSVRESDFARPLEWYGQSKLEAERLAEKHAHQVPITIVRLPAVYGPRDRGFLAAFKQASSNVAFHAIPPRDLFDLVHVHDAVSALLLAVEHPSSIGRTYFVASDTSLSWQQLYDQVSQLAGVNPIQLVVPLVLLRLGALIGDARARITGRMSLITSQKLAMANAGFWLCDSTRIRQELGWRPAITPQNGIRDTYLWYVGAGWLRVPHSVAPSVTHSVDSNAE